MSATPRAVDVTFLARTATAAIGFQLALAVVAQYRRDAAIDVAKLRVAGDADVPPALRAELLCAARRRFASSGPPLVTMWIASDLAEVNELDGSEANAFFFRWDLHASPGTPAATAPLLEKIDALVAAGRLVLLHLAIKTAADLRRQLATMQWAARKKRLVSANCRWEVALVDPSVLFFAPASCRRGDAPAVRAIEHATKQLAALGIAAHGHVTSQRLCPAEQPDTYLFDDTGRKPWCEHPAVRARDAQVQDPCMACDAATVCAARCPATSGYGHPSAACRAWRKELARWGR
jgi:hypothetical protein